MLTKKELKAHLLQELHAPYLNCTLCPLSNGRTQVVFGRGNPDAPLMLIGEAPGQNEDAEGKPFVGRSGKLLEKVFRDLGIQEDDLYITNIVKCRPPGNRTPSTSEIETCSKTLLHKEILIIKPRVICVLGASAAQFFITPVGALSKLRTQEIMYLNSTVIITYHPAYILRTPKALSCLSNDLKNAYALSITD